MANLTYQLLCVLQEDADVRFQVPPVPATTTTYLLKRKELLENFPSLPNSGTFRFFSLSHCYPLIHYLPFD